MCSCWNGERKIEWTGKGEWMREKTMVLNTKRAFIYPKPGHFIESLRTKWTSQFVCMPYKLVLSSVCVKNKDLRFKKREKNRWKFKSQKLERFKLNRRQKKPCGQRERTNAYWHRINWCGAVVRKMVAHFSSLSAWSVQWVDNWSLKTNLIYFNHIDK